MTDNAERPSPSDSDGSETDSGDEALTVDELIDAADDPSSEKQKTGEAQAAENEELEPPA